MKILTSFTLSKHAVHNSLLMKNITVLSCKLEQIKSNFIDINVNFSSIFHMISQLLLLNQLNCSKYLRDDKFIASFFNLRIQKISFPSSLSTMIFPINLLYSKSYLTISIAPVSLLSFSPLLQSVE
jgi:hypothetical protein